MPSTLAHEKQDGSLLQWRVKHGGRCSSRLSLTVERKHEHLLQPQKPPSHLSPALSSGSSHEHAPIKAAKHSQRDSGSPQTQGVLRRTLQLRLRYNQ